MPIQETGNKGEWSELYVLLRLLADGKLYAADSEINKRNDTYYDVINIIRREKIGLLSFAFDMTKTNVNIFVDKDEIPRKSISVTKFAIEAKKLFDVIKQENHASFKVDSAVDFMKEIFCSKLKAPSEDKADIKITIHDPNANFSCLQGFSIKSKAGKPSTLLNAGKNTNFIYEISENCTDANMNAINGLMTQRGDISVENRLNYLREHNLKLTYYDMAGQIFKNNLLMIDGMLPQIISELLFDYYFNGITNLNEATERLTQNNPLHYDLSQAQPFYKYKVKKMLTEIAVGMLPGHIWNGYADATGGFIVVKANGEVLCYHLYHRNDFEDYLLKNLRFDRGGANRHDYAKVEKMEGRYFIKLNLQIRFIE